jgi:hypothetical protein
VGKVSFGNFGKLSVKPISEDLVTGKGENLIRNRKVRDPKIEISGEGFM